MPANKKNVLLLTLVHPDFLPPVYSVAQVLRDLSYNIHILTFDSYVKTDVDLGNNITIESVGKHHDVRTMRRMKLKSRFATRAKQLVNEAPIAIIAFCPFSFLTALNVKNTTPIFYIALEVADFIMPVFLRSPLTNFNNLRAIKNIHKADLIATPSFQRSAWLAGRAHLDRMPFTILNTVYLTEKKDDTAYSTFKTLIAEPLLDKKIILYTGTVNDHLCIKELVQTFDRVNDERCALVITGMKDNTYCNEIRAFVKQCKTSDRIVLFPHLTRTEMLSLQANADIGVCLAKEYSDNVESKMMAPNKVGEYLAKGLYLFSINNEYMVPFAMKGIASLSQSTSIADMSIALKDALIAVNDDQSKITISNFVKDYFCMQKQLKPVIDYLSTL